MGYHIYNEEEIKWIKENYYGLSNKKFVYLFNEKFNTNFSKGSILHQKYKYNLKPGKRFEYSPRCIKPIGYERKNRNGYILIKVENPDKWRLKHHVIFEKETGEKIKKRDKIIFIDGDKYNFDINNLCLLSSSENFIFNKEKFKNYNPEITKAGITLAKIKSKLNKISKEKLK